MSSDSFKNFNYKLFPLQIIFINQDLALNSQQVLICHKIQTTNQPSSVHFIL